MNYPFQALIALGLLGVAACDAQAPINDENTPAKTSLALRNLDAQIEGVRAQVQRHPGYLGNHSTLVQLLKLRAHLRGDIADYVEMETLAVGSLPESPLAKERFLKASVLEALHRFDQADVEYQSILEDGVSLIDLERAQGKLALTRGTIDPNFVAAQEAAYEQTPSYSTASALATTYSALALYAEADALYAEATDYIVDPSPLVPAWLHFQRGLMWSERADDGVKGREFYEMAVELVPEYSVANLHLAEIEFDEGEETRAIGRLERLTHVSSDPEIAFRLAEMLPMGPQRTEMREQAITGFDERVEVLPLAYADHAAELWMSDVGQDPRRAHDLAELNLENRKGDRSYSLAIRAAAAAGELDRACELAAVDHPIKSTSLQAVVDETLAQCDD